MKTRKQTWIAALCLLSATVVTIGLRPHVKAVQAATSPFATTAVSNAPAAHLANASLRAAVVSDAMLDDDAGATRVTSNLQAGRITFPPVEQFTLTPPNPAQNINLTNLTVHFGGNGAADLPSQIRMMLGNQRVLVQRSGDDPNAYVANINFDWQAFANEQQQRKEAAANGKMVAIFSGRRFIRTEPMQFLDPEQIQEAQRSHQSIQLSPDMLIDGPINVVPDHELMIAAIPVVEDSQRTFDQCLSGNQGTQTGAWTFATLMEAIACSTGSGNCTQQAAENMLLSMLSQWQSTQTINSFPVPARNIGSLGQSGLLGNWPEDPSGAAQCTLNGQQSACPSLPRAPVHLLAIVNRIDLGQNGPPFAPAGELRFVFGVTAGTSFNGTPQPCSAEGNFPFTIILEYKVPSRFNTPQSWARVWNALEENGTFDATYRSELQTTITDQVVTAGACTDSSGHTISCISQIRSNEVEITSNGLWEQRQFQLPTVSLGTRPVLNMVTVSMTPDSSFNFSQNGPPCGSQILGIHACNNGEFLLSWINANQSEILQTDGALPIVPNVVTNNQGQTATFLGGSAFNNSQAFWVDRAPTNSEQARSDFSLNTCNGCHGGETNTPFLQVHNRPATGNNDQSAPLSNFLLGCVPTSGSCGLNNPGPQSCPQQCPINTPGQVSVTDPNDNSKQNIFGDILRRQIFMGGLGTNGPGSGGMLLPFLAQPVGVH